MIHREYGCRKELTELNILSSSFFVIVKGKLPMKIFYELKLIMLKVGYGGWQNRSSLTP